MTITDIFTGLFWTIVTLGGAVWCIGAYQLGKELDRWFGSGEKRRARG